MLLRDDVVQVWFADLRASAEQVDHLSALLNQDELARARQFSFAEGRRRFTVARAFLRQVLGLHLNVDPKCVEFRYETRGKPALAHGHALEFNLSHSYDAGAAAVACRRRVGIDIEVMRDNVDFDGIARRYFCTAEAERVVRSQGSARRIAFFSHWTGKEAYLKAQGDGLFAPLDSFEVIPGSSHGAPACLNIDDVHEHGRWSIQLIRPSQDSVCAIVAEGRDWHIAASEWVFA